MPFWLVCQNVFGTDCTYNGQEQRDMQYNIITEVFIYLYGSSWPWSYGSWIYNCLCNQCLSPLMLWVWIPLRARCTTLCDKVWQWLATGLWFSPCPSISSINKTDRRNITEILLKVALNTIKQTNKQFIYLPWSWNKNKPIRLTRSPRLPTISNNLGSLISSISTKRLSDSTKIEKHNAIRNTAFTKAPTISARIQPNVFFSVCHFEIWKTKQ